MQPLHESIVHVVDSPVRMAIRVVGELLITSGVLTLLFVFWLLFWTGYETSLAQDRLGEQLRRDVDRSVTTAVPGRTQTRSAPVSFAPDAGDPYFRMRIPRLGDQWDWVVVEGVDFDQLALGPGHYPGTARPGQRGNLVIAAHRATHGEPFAHLDRMRPGDEVIITRRARQWFYRVSRTFITSPDDVSVLGSSAAGGPQQQRSARVTLITCEPRWGSSHRLIVVGELVRPA